MDLKKSPLTNGPSRAILVTSAICFSVILAAVAYKVTLSKKLALQTNNIIGIAGTTTDPADLVNNAIYDSQAAALTQNSTSTSPFAIKPEDSVSDRVSKKLFSGYLYAQQADGVTDSSVNEVSNTVLSQINQSDLPTPFFLSSQISIFVPTSKNEIQTYGNSVAGIILQNFNNIADSNNLKETAKIYKKIANSLVLIQTPIEMRGNQVSLANSFYMMGQGMEMLTLQTSDPVRALLGVKTLKEINQVQANVLISMGEYFNKNAILFSNEVDGSFWNQYINLHDQNKP